ncbi:DapH/DapD/GlmU-related protein [Thiomicrorhabdus sp.]|uniref:acyltransferase n=1 Tax=Thiomicrorhabdus sp. TaxID=2039724 RepID=UPI00356B2BAF
MKRVIKKIIFSSFSKLFIMMLAIALGYKSEIFKSKYFKTEYIGFIWLLKSFWFQRILGFNRFKSYPVHPTCTIASTKNLTIHLDSINNLMSPGCYYQNFAGKIIVEKDVYIGPNTGVITANHDPMKPQTHLEGEDVVIREGCWIGMNCVILPGVELGPNTVVAAGSVVTKSYTEGCVLIAGSPAVIKKLLHATDETQ